MMNYVYKLTFIKRLSINKPPYYYIGYKTNAIFKDGIIFDKNNKPYYSSSKSKILLEEVNENPKDILVDILFESHDPIICQEKEREFQLSSEVITNPEYFNMAITPINIFNLPNYGSYKHKDFHDKKVRLPTNHELVLNGTYVGITKGMTIDKSSIRGFGNFKDRDGNVIRCRVEDPRVLSGELVGITRGSTTPEEVKLKMSISHSGRTKSESHKRKIGDANRGRARPDVTERFKNTLVFENLLTGERKRECADYSEDNWKPFNRSGKRSAIKHNHYNTIWINNGINEKKLKKYLEIPTGWVKGRIKNAN